MSVQFAQSRQDSIPTLHFASNLRVTDKLDILTEFHAVVAEIRERAAIRLSYARIHAVMEDHLAENEFFTSVDGGPPKRRAFNNLVCARTIRNVLNCKLDIRAARLQDDTFLFISAFCQLYRIIDISYL